MNAHPPLRRTVRADAQPHGLRRRKKRATASLAVIESQLTWEWNRILVWCLGIAVFSLMTSARATAQTQPVIAPDPIILRVTSTAAPREFKEEVIVTTAGLPAPFRSSPVDWAPKLQGQQPLQRLGDPAGKERYLQIGNDTKSRSFLKIDFSRPQLVQGAMESRLAIVVEDPRDLEVGTYEGFIDATMRLAVGPTDELEYRWPVVVIVEGRQLLDVSFSHGSEYGGNLTVGSPASVKVTVDILGEYELGQGTLELGLLSNPSDANSYKQLIKTVPIPREEIIDCLTDLGEDGSFCKVPHWSRDQLIYTRILSDDEQGTQVSHSARRSRYHDAILKKYQNPLALQRLAFEAVMPDCYEVGTLRATVSWPSVEAGGQVQKAVFEEAIGPGIWISLHAALVGENLNIALVTRTGLDNPEVEIVDRETKQVIHRVPLVMSGQTSTVSPALLYSGKYLIGSDPPYSLVVRGTGTAATLRPANLDIYFSKVTSFLTETKRLPIFVNDPAPVWIQTVRGTDGGIGGGVAQREGAVTYYCLKGRLTEPKLRWRGIGHPGAEGEYLPFSEGELGTQPELTLSNSTLEKARENTWPFIPVGSKSDMAAVGIEANISHWDDSQKKSAIGGTQVINLRLSFEAFDGPEGRVYRIINEPIYYEVTTFRQFCWPFILGLGFFSGFIVLAGGTIFAFNRWVSPSRGLVPDQEVEVTSMAEDDGRLVPEGSGGFDMIPSRSPVVSEKKSESPPPSVPAPTGMDVNFLPESKNAGFQVGEQQDFGNLLPPD